MLGVRALVPKLGHLLLQFRVRERPRHEPKMAWLAEGTPQIWAVRRRFRRRRLYPDRPRIRVSCWPIAHSSLTCSS
jgi:hypothetical protein